MYVLLSTDHWQDVVAGSALGILTAYFSYRQYFPSLSSKLSHLPYSPRIQHLEATRDISPDTLPQYRDSAEGQEVELLRGTVRRDEPSLGPSVESEHSHV
jgi:hypothetical protein